jgi:hypothetical protein
VPLSSAFLYVGIVAIWAFVLVPRWLRRPQAVPEPTAEYEPDYQGEADYDDQPGHEEPGYDPQTDEQPGHDQLSDEPRTTSESMGANGGGHAGAAAFASAPGPASPEAPAVRRSVPSLPRSRVLRARRRLLTLLLLLCAGAATCTALKLTSWWACAPPAGMLGIYLLLLREAALADAEQARWRVAVEMRVQAARQREHAAWAAEAEEQSAQIIDISARVSDQLYDQYADATIRAVGD